MGDVLYWAVLPSFAPSACGCLIEVVMGDLLCWAMSCIGYWLVMGDVLCLAMLPSFALSTYGCLIEVSSGTENNVT